MRSDYCADRCQFGNRLPATASSHQIPRCPDRQDFQLPDQQLRQTGKTVADLYHCRWQVELFFKWIKQHLRIKSFFGASENAVKSQIWTAISVYVLVAIIKKRLGIKADLYTILQVLSLTLFEKTTLKQIFTEEDFTMQDRKDAIQLNLFDNLTGH